MTIQVFIYKDSHFFEGNSQKKFRIINHLSKRNVNSYCKKVVKTFQSFEEMTLTKGSFIELNL